MEQFDNIFIDKKISESKIFLRSLSLDYKKNFIHIENKITAEIEEIEKSIKENKKTIPELNYQQIVSNSIDNNLVNLVKKRGCVIIRNVFEKKQVEFWNNELSKYIDQNNYYEDQKEKAGLDKYFSDLESGKPQIFGLYWSKPQVEVRQSKNMAIVKTWLNKLWINEFNNQI